MSGQDEGPGGVAEPGSGAEHEEDGPGPGGGAQGQMELGSLRAFVEAGLHNVDARLDQQAVILAQMQGMLQDAVVPGQAAGDGVAQQGAPVGMAEGPGGPIVGVAGPGELPGGAAPLAVAGPGSQAEKMAAKARLGLWQSPTSRKYWMIAGERPSLTGAKRQEIQDLLHKRVLVTSDIATQLEALSVFDVAGYMPRSATANSIAESMFPLADQLAILSHAVCTVVGYGIDHPASAARLQILAGAFEKWIGVIREHALDYFQTMMVPANRNRLVKLINSDVTDWSSELFRAGVIAG
eukprot:jgi/Undpi1/12845/HiC_scaffold_7.g02512.m1